MPASLNIMKALMMTLIAQEVAYNYANIIIVISATLPSMDRHVDNTF